MESMGKWAMRFIILIEVYRISEDVNQELHKGLLLIFFVKGGWNH